MWKLLQYYAKYQGMRGNLGGLPRWAKWILFLFALPGIIGILLSILALAVSILALLLLTVPVYRLLTRLSGGRGADQRPGLPLEVEGVTVDNAYTVDTSDGPDDYVGDDAPPSDREPSGPIQTVDVIDTPRSPATRRHVDVKIIE